MPTKTLTRAWQSLEGKITPEVLVAPKTCGDPRNKGRRWKSRLFYDRHKSWRGPRRRKNGDSGGQGIAPAQRPINPNRDTARVRNRLTRQGKDALADRVLELEQGFAVQEEQWLRLNDQLLQWRLRAEKAEGQVEKLRRSLDAKDAKVRGLQNRLDHFLTADSGLTDAAVRHVLQETLERAQKAEEQAKDLRLRLFARKVIHIRDLIRRLDKKGTVKTYRSAKYRQP